MKYVAVLSGTPSRGKNYAKDRLDVGVDYWRELYRKGEKPRLLMTSMRESEKENDDMYKDAISQIPKEFVEVLPASNSTAEDLKIIKERIGKENLENLIIVTSEFHMPRTKYWAKRIFGKYKPEFVASLSGTDAIDLIRRLFIEKIYITTSQIATAGVSDGNDRHVLKKYRQIEKAIEKIVGNLYKTNVITN